MKITNVHLVPIHTPRESGDVSQHVLVELQTDAGIEGVGEMSDVTDLPLTMPDLGDLEKSLVNVLGGLDPRRVTQIDHLLSLLFAGRNDPGIYTGNIKCGVEMAVHDLVGKRLGIPLYEYFGGPVRTEIKVCYPLFRCHREADVEANLQRTRSLVSEGFDVIRVYIGANPDMDALLLGALRTEFGDQVRMQSFDLSGHLSRMDAFNLIQRLRQFYEPEYMESVCPLDDIRGMADLRRRLNLPVSEHTGNVAMTLQLWEADAVDIINVQTTALGGLREALRHFALAEALHLRCILSTTQETSLGTAGVAHVGASVINVDYPTVAVGPKLYTADVARNPIQYRNGFMQVPAGPGLGIEVDWDAVGRLSAPLGWAQHEIQQEIVDVHDKPWKVALGTGLKGVRKK